MDEAVIQVSDFRKVYGKVVAVDGVGFTVRRGEIFGLLGPNGAGKTTTLECLEGLRWPDGGTLRVIGINPARNQHHLRDAIGVQLQTSGLPPSMTVDEAMRFFCAYHGVTARLDLIERLGLAEKRHTQYQMLSTGQQRRLALALALAHNPPVLFLDEPTAGLDVASRAALHDLIREQKSAGCTILLATHDMAEAEKMADRVAILLRGKIVAIGSPMELTATGSVLTKVSVHSEGDSLSRDVPFPGVRRQAAEGEYRIYYTETPGPTVAAIISCIDAQGDRLIDLRVQRPSLEERFLEITAVPQT